MFFKRAKLESTLISNDQAKTAAPLNISTKKAERLDNILLHSPLYRFKRDVLSLVAKMNQGSPHPDYEVIKKQAMFINYA